MKAVKWIAFSVMLVSGLTGLAAFLIPRIYARVFFPEAAAIGIIGSADGPTAIFVSAGKLSPLFFGLGWAVVFSGSALTWLLTRRKTRR